MKENDPKNLTGCSTLAQYVIVRHVYFIRVISSTWTWWHHIWPILTCAKCLANSIPLCMRQPLLWVTTSVPLTQSHLLAGWRVREVTEHYVWCSEWGSSHFMWSVEYLIPTRTRHLEGCAFAGVMTLGVYCYRDRQTAGVCVCLWVCACLQTLAFTH